MGAANLLSVDRRAPLPGGAGRLRRRGDAAGGDGRPGQRARGRRHPDDDRARLPRRGRRREDIEALIGRLNTLRERRHRGGRRGRGGARGRRRGHRAPRVGRRRAGDQARQLRSSARPSSEGASDIHFEPDEDEMRVRFRVDGVLHEAARVPKRMVAGRVSRVKIMSDLDIAEKRVPQDGRVERQRRGPPVDLRVTTLPTQRGEGASIRILDKEQALRTLDELGMDGDGARALRGRLPPALRRGAGHRADRLGQVDHALRGARRSSTTSRRTSSRSRTRSSTSSTGINQIQVNRKAGLDLRHRPALDPARRPRRDHGRRDPRRARRRGSRSRPRSPATWCSRRCTPTTPRARSPA